MVFMLELIHLDLVLLLTVELLIIILVQVLMEDTTLTLVNSVTQQTLMLVDMDGLEVTVVLGNLTILLVLVMVVKVVEDMVTMVH